MKKVFLLPLLFVIFFSYCHGQKFESTVEVGTFTYLAGTVSVKPGPDWRGYYLPRNGKTGIRITSVNSIFFHGFSHFGIGVSYANYDKIHGIQLFSDMRFDMSRKRLAPFYYLSPGFSHFWNQYEGGRGTLMLDSGFGLRHKIGDDNELKFSTGLLFMQQSGFISARIGYTL